MHFIANFDEVWPNAIRIDLSQLDWLTRKSSDTLFEIEFHYPMMNSPNFGDFVYVCEGDKPVFTGYVLDVQEKELTLINARHSSGEQIE